MRKNLFFTTREFSMRLLILASSFFIAGGLHAQLLQSWVKNNPVSLPNTSLPTVKDAIVAGADGNIVVSGKNSLTKLTPAGGQIWTTALTSFPAGYTADGMAIVLDNSDNIYLTVVNANINSSVFTGDEDIFVAKFNSAGTPQWSTWFDGPAGFRDKAAGIAVDESGNVYVSGSSQINPPSFYSKIITLKYNTAGALQWSVTYDGSDNSVANDIAVDFYTGDVYVAGSSLIAGNYNDFTTIKYNTNGGQEWIKLVNGNAPFTQDDQANAITIDQDGNVLVTGFLTSYYESSCCGDQDARVYQTFKYDRITGNQIWRKGYGSKQSDGDNYFHSVALAIVADGNDNVIVTGYSELKSDGSKEWATVKYRAIDGATDWVRRYNNAAYIPEDIFDDDNDVANSIGFDSEDFVYVSGYSKSNDGGYDYVTIKYNHADGNEVGFARYNGGEFDKPSDILVDWTGNVYVTGRSQGITTVKYASCVISCPANITAIIAPSQCGANVSFPAATTTGNCGSLEYSHASGSYFPTGITTVTVTSPATQQYCTFTVNVFDNVPPTLTACPADVTVYTGAGRTTCNQAATWTPPVGTDNCSATLTSTHTPGSLFPVGTTIVTYTVTDLSANSVSCSFKVTVIDNTPPVITCPSSQILALNNTCAASLPDYRNLAAISDNCTAAGSILISQLPAPGTIVYGKGTLTIKLEAKDAAGNVSSCTFTVTKTDVTAPQISCPPGITVFAGKDKCSAIVSNAKLGNAIANDNCTGQLTIVRTGIPNGNVFPVGITIITYKATDAANNTSTCTQTITVIDNQAPVINCPPDFVVNAPNNSCSKKVNYTITATDNCSVQSLISNPASGSVFNVGKTIVVVIATDASGNTSTTSFTVTVKDNTPPVIICPPNVTVNTELGLCKAIVNPGTATATDNCSVVAITGKRSDNKPLHAYYPVGTTTITWKAKDASGNISTCEQKIKVKDNQPPVITNVNVNPAVLWPADHSMKTIIVNYNSTDNCGPDDNCSYDCQLSVTSNEPISGTGNGDLSPDWQIIDDHKVKLRAERKDNGTGRIYTIKITCTDEAGNKTIQTIAVSVPLTAPLITSSQSTKMTQATTEKEIPSTFATGFIAQVMPNPSEREFNLVIKGGSNEAREIRVFDITGREVKKIKSAASNVIRFGDNLVQGTYIVEVRQGKNKAVLKVVKQ